ncbi:penicillin-binding protein, beta-lactamase class C [Saccharomonospora marina XMU15]|uniref:Penicillin-binding protein, beta-lactamase class C n=1 Tax=Saccharomonospora marina XMU15 TaxID=882083 RepID=H5X6R1_9PSEU|nr:EstA family serine hydrolase [Saccharomonospora marina]EHR51282.1 penicillin-binding protein, beta-lactamase class C [Saccharomonospora marina XMU15]
MTAVVAGHCEDRFSSLRTLLERSLDSGADVGASVCVSVAGEVVVDLHGGRMGEHDHRPWSAETIVNVYSVTKPMTALAVLLLVDRGELELDAPVSRYWPQFAAAGKDGVEVGHLLSHTSGVSGWAEPITLEQLYDTEQAAQRLAGQPPWWPPGTRSGYHALSYGHLLAELVRRVTGTSLGRFFAAELAAPLGADFHIGTPAEHADRVAALVPPPAMPSQGTAWDPDSIAARTLTNPVVPVSATSTPGWRGAEIGAAGGHGNARSVARLHALFSGRGESAGVRLLSEPTVRAALRPRSRGTDLVLGASLRFGAGLAVGPAAAVPAVPDGEVCWWAGFGGSLVVSDLDRELTLAYVPNAMEPGLLNPSRGNALLAATYTALGEPSGSATG